MLTDIWIPGPGISENSFIHYFWASYSVCLQFKCLNNNTDYWVYCETIGLIPLDYSSQMAKTKGFLIGRMWENMVTLLRILILKKKCLIINLLPLVFFFYFFLPHMYTSPYAKWESNWSLQFSICKINEPPKPH